ncbi:MAG: DUF4412 domain-containing protein [Candidatus Delongbacteria bacterium]|jgi:hypothetical protein|nr:DUF4412 domain-containing protein [Candidatus Delongbacteria bacterium]
MYKKTSMLLVFIISVSALLSKDYYIKQLIISPNHLSNLNDTLVQETYVMKDLIIVKDDVSVQFTGDSLYTFYNLVDSTYFSKNAKELAEVALYADLQFEEFSISSQGKKEKIGKWNTEKYLGKVKVMGMEMELDLFISKDTGLPNDLLFKQQEKMNASAPNIKKMLETIKGTGGIVLKEVARIQGIITSTKETIEAKEIKVSKKIFERPKGFTKLIK